MGLGGQPTQIDGHTRLVGLIGWPVAHSLSPRMHNAAFAALKLNYVYLPLPVSPERVGHAVQGLAALGFAGANVTIPHKTAVLPFVEHFSPVAAGLGAANTLVVRPDGTLFADNTDVAGFLADLRAHRVDPGAGSASAPFRALVIGAGGAARAIVYALAEAGAEVQVANRTLANALELCQTIGAVLPRASLSAHPFPQGLRELAGGANLIVNATSLGLHGARDPLPWDRAVPFRQGQAVYDLVYSRSTEAGPAGETPFLSLAAQAGAITMSGLGMLVQQGARSFELWTGQRAAVEVMYTAIASA